eukprot:10932319-Ditylum_brightwellii.AAC.1
MLTHFGDNKMVVQKIQCSQKRTILIPTSTLWADYNAQMQIDVILQDICLSEEEEYSIEHVKGHKEEENLMYQAELNNVANDLATNTRESLTWKQYCTSLPLYPASHITVSIKNMLITHTLDREPQQAYTSIKFRAHLEEKFKWNATTADLVDWELHGSNFLRLNFYQHWFVVKLIHECLPRLGEPFVASIIKTCPCCKHLVETFGHLMYCSQNPEKWQDLQVL